MLRQKYLGLERALNIDVSMLEFTWNVYLTLWNAICASLLSAIVALYTVDVHIIAQMGFWFQLSSNDLAVK